eukprot:TRINITY_DN40262_c0_g1_i1.p2 TRINITY_DN40262_c0_g1~~TRINITY_DN40262_c0_g1_i1.p2  ORF type:complete len:102 (-),score=21.08 TRINITY_DN40262_c0_g1_i1:4-309(-)
MHARLNRESMRLSAGLLCLLAGSAGAQVAYVWESAVNGSWTDSVAWDPDGVPGAAEMKKSDMYVKKIRKKKKGGRYAMKERNCKKRFTKKQKNYGNKITIK